MIYLDTLALWQTDPRLLVSNDKHIGFTCGERVVNGILDVYNIEATVVAFSMSDDTHTTHVTTTSHHSDDTSIEANEVRDFSRRKIKFDGIVDLDGWIGIANPR